MDILKKIRFSVTLDAKAKVVRYSYNFSEKYVDYAIKWEKYLYDFAEKVKALDFKPYIVINDESLFKRGKFGFGWLNFFYKDNNNQKNIHPNPPFIH